MATFKLYFCIALYLLTISLSTCSKHSKQFTYNGFHQAEALRLDGNATIQPIGLLQLTNNTKQAKGHVFDPVPIVFGASPSSFSFSTTFAFVIYPELQTVSGEGIVFFLSPTMDFTRATVGQFLGLFNASTIGNSSNHIFAVEIDTVEELEFDDIDSNHVGIDVNDLKSNASVTAGYFSDSEKRNKSLNLISAKPMQIWIDYDGIDMLVKVTLAPLGVGKPSKPLLSTHIDLSQIVKDTMYAGLSASTGAVASAHYVLGWSFSQGSQSQALDLSKLPSLPPFGTNNNRKFRIISIVMVVITLAMVMLVCLGFYLRWRKRFEEILEDWEQEYILQRFSYRELYKATKGFQDKGVLGIGGFGKVYKGKLTSTKVEVAIKRVSHNSGQGIKEFVAEIACMARLRHRNLVQLLGYCRRKGELFLVYDYMPNGSLDKRLYNHQETDTLSWATRFKIIKDIASSLVYLHEAWEQVVVHRDIKPSNVLLDTNMNARLGDFGLARLYDHGTNPQTTHVVGTVGYLAPELIRRGKAGANTDVYSFGVTVLECVCGRSPVSNNGESAWNLIDWVHSCWMRRAILEAGDTRLAVGGNYVVEEVELVLKIGMLCTHTRPEARPNMRQVMQYLDGDCTLPDIIPYDAKLAFSTTSATLTLPSFPSSSSPAISTCLSSDSILLFGR